MVTFFTCPKPFTNPHIATIQRNAIYSWTLLKTRPDVILFGNEVGLAAAAAELGVRHIPEIARNECGTPLLNDVFAKAELAADKPLLCYINADIILLDSFIDALSVVLRRKKRFVMGGRPWNVDVTERLTFDGDWQRRLISAVQGTGVLRGEYACDYFVYPKHLWGSLPPFALGRGGFDNALLYLARRRGFALVDATNSVRAIHQNHGYPSGLGPSGYASHPEVRHNTELVGGLGRLYSWRYATHQLTCMRLQRYWRGSVRHWKAMVQHELWFPALAATRPLRHAVGLRKKAGRTAV